MRKQFISPLIILGMVIFVFPSHLEAQQKETYSSGPNIVQTVPVPNGLFFLFDEAMAFQVGADKGQVVKNVEIDLSSIKAKSSNFSEVQLKEYVGGQLQDISFSQRDGKLLANLEGGKTYVVFRWQKTGRFANTYDTLCMVDRFRERFRPQLTDRICTQILCSPDGFRAPEFFENFSELGPIKNEMISSMGRGDSFGQWELGGFGGPGGGSVCDHCGDFGHSGVVIPSKDCGEIIAPGLRVEIEINQTPTSHDDYVTWAPTFSRARIAGVVDSSPDPLTVVLRNDTSPEGGEVLFAHYKDPWPVNTTATQNILTLNLPRNGQWVNFVVAGRFGFPSTYDKDTVIQTHEGSASGKILGIKKLMVRVRKDANKLTPAERDRFLIAMRKLRNQSDTGPDADGNARGYLMFQELHRLATTVRDGTGDLGHHQPAFLPWHRALLLHLERELQKIDPSVALPYWNWDRRSPNVFSILFIGFPGIGDSPPPVHFHWTNPLNGWDTDLGMSRLPGSLSYGVIRRMRGDHQTFPDWTDFHFLDEPNVEILNEFGPGLDNFLSPENARLLNRPNLMQFNDYGPNNDSSSFSGAMELFSHDYAHGWTCGGGHIFAATRSAADPLFYLLHSQVDRQWAYWQWKKNRFGISGGAQTFAAPEHYENAGVWNDPGNTAWFSGAYLNDGIWPWDSLTGPGGTGSRDDRPVNQASPADVDSDLNVPRSRPKVPQKPFPASAISNLWPSSPSAARPRDMIDYLGKFDPKQGLGFSYDDVPYGYRRLVLVPPDIMKLQAEFIERNKRLSDIFINPNQSKAKRLEALKSTIGDKKNVQEKIFTLIRNPNEEDDVRLEATRHVPLGKNLLVASDKIINNPQAGSENLKANLLTELSRRAMIEKERGAQEQVVAWARKNLDSPLARVRLTSFQLLVSSGDVEAANRLARGLRYKDTPPIPIAAALHLLNLFGSARHIDSIRPFLDHPDIKVKAQAVEGLSADRPSWAKIMELLFNPETPFEIRNAAIVPLSRHDPKFPQYAFKILKNSSESDQFRRAVVKAMVGKMNYQKVLEKDQIEFYKIVEALSEEEEEKAQATMEAPYREVLDYLKENFAAVKYYAENLRAG